jgi:hypothetical protein
MPQASDAKEAKGFLGGRNKAGRPLEHLIVLYVTIVSVPGPVYILIADINVTAQSGPLKSHLILDAEFENVQSMICLLIIPPILFQGVLRVR